MRNWHGNLSPFGLWHTAGRDFSPFTLFAGGEEGVWYDPSDLTTLFQDTAGTTPVTTPGQSVALMLDKSKGAPTLGPELFDTAYFNAQDTSATSWTDNGDATYTHDGTSGTKFLFFDGFPFIGGHVYAVSFTVSGATTGTLNAKIDAGATYSVDSNGNYTFYYTAPSGQDGFQFTSISGFDGTLSNISVRELPGYHATQSTAAARPKYGIVPETGRRNLLGYTEQFDNVVWTKSAVTITANAITAPDGTVTAERITATAVADEHAIYQGITATPGNTFSVYAKKDTAPYVGLATEGGNGARAVFDLENGTVVSSLRCTPVITDVGSGWYRCAIQNTEVAVTFPVIAPLVSDISPWSTWTADGTEAIFIWGAQAELGTTATAYQAVTTDLDVTEAGVPSLGYLSFDGVDDSMVTPTITPGTDKVQVFAGVRKLSDAVAASAVEYSTGSGNGRFRLMAPSGDGETRYRFVSFGTSGGNQLSSSSAAPVSDVIVGLGDISGDSSIIRVNGIGSESTSDQGTGNFLAYSIYFGSRAGTSAFFTGHIYSLITRFGPNLDAPVIGKTETYVAKKTGVDLT